MYVYIATYQLHFGIISDNNDNSTTLQSIQKLTYLHIWHCVFRYEIIFYSFTFNSQDICKTMIINNKIKIN